MATVEAGGDGLRVGQQLFERERITAIRAAIRVYDCPPSTGERVRDLAGRFLGVVLGPLVQLLFALVVMAMVAAMLFVLGDLLGYTLREAMPVAVPFLLVAGAMAWRIGRVMAQDVNLAVLARLVVPQRSVRFHVLLVETDDEESHPVLASADFRAVDEMRRQIRDRLARPSAEPYRAQLDISEGNWITSDRMIVEADRIDFR